MFALIVWGCARNRGKEMRARPSIENGSSAQVNAALRVELRYLNTHNDQLRGIDETGCLPFGRRQAWRYSAAGAGTG